MAPIPTDYKDFDTQYELLRKFGPKALSAAIKSEIKANGVAAVDEKFIKGVIGNQISNFLELSTQAGLINVQNLLRQENTPRGDYQAEAVNRNILQQQGPATGQTQQFQALPKNISDKLGLAAAPIAREATNNKALTTQYNQVLDKMENDVRNEHKARLKMAMSPRPGATKKIEPRF